MHQGFWETWEAVASNVTSKVEAALSAYPGYTLIATGHSLGGALAAVAATVFRASGHTVQLVCFSIAYSLDYSIIILTFLSMTMVNLVLEIWP